MTAKIEGSGNLCEIYSLKFFKLLQNYKMIIPQTGSQIT